MMRMAHNLFLGLEGSTQTFKAVVINEDQVVGDTITVSYDEIQPLGFGLNKGYWKCEGSVFYGSPQMWAKAMDIGLLKLKESGLSDKVVALSGDGQQHGHVALKRRMQEISQRLNQYRPLDVQLMEMGAFARSSRIGHKRRAVAPIWMDNSTTSYLNDIIAAAGSLTDLILLTGSGAFERFTGPQYMRFVNRAPAAYAKSVELPLVSTFHNGLLGGGYVITPGDAAGTSLMNIKTRNWEQKMFEAVASDLNHKLPVIIDPNMSCGDTSKFAQERYGLKAKLFPWEGDNPSSSVGVGGVVPGRVVISLGTSDTFFGNTGENLVVDSEGELCVFGASTDFRHNMYLGCWKNGSEERERVAKDFGMDWGDVSDYLLKTEPHEGKMGVYWTKDEITPKARGGTYRHTEGFSDDYKYHVKAVVEGKIMSMLIRLRKINVEPKEIYVTAGASENDGILQTIADVTGAKVYRQSVKDSAPLGGALRARYGWLKSQSLNPTWQDVVAPFISVKDTFTPNGARHAVYERMLPKYQAFEADCARESRK